MWTTAGWTDTRSTGQGCLRPCTFCFRGSGEEEELIGYFPKVPSQDPFSQSPLPASLFLKSPPCIHLTQSHPCIPIPTVPSLHPFPTVPYMNAFPKSPHIIPSLFSQSPPCVLSPQSPPCIRSPQSPPCIPLSVIFTKRIEHEAVYSESVKTAIY